MATKIPAFTYTGQYSTELNGDRWYIYLKSGGTLRFSYGKTCDLFLCGGGAGGGRGGNGAGGGGGGGGYTQNVYDVSVDSGIGYDVVIGSGGSGWSSHADGKGYTGGTTSALGYSALGGNGGSSTDSGSGGGGSGTGYGGRGGSGTGSAGYDGQDGILPFNDFGSIKYGAGGGGGKGSESSYGDGGDSGGGGANRTSYGVANTGGGGRGGGGEWGSGSSGGSGIVIVRGTQDDYLPVTFDGTTMQKMFFNGNEVKHLILDGTQIFCERVRRWAQRLRRKTRSALHAV